MGGGRIEGGEKGLREGERPRSSVGQKGLGL